MSVFDHGRQYAFTTLRSALEGQTLIDASLDEGTADLFLTFANGASFEIFNFTAYEIWEVLYPDGSRELSNYAREPQP